MGFEFTKSAPAMLAVAGALALSLGAALSASAQDLQSRLDHAQSELEQTKDQAGVLTTTIERNADQVTQLRGEIATLRNREAVVEEELRAQEVELARDWRRLASLRAHLRRSLNDLRTRLVAINRSGQPDSLTVVLDSGGFDDLTTRFEYLRRIEENDASIIGPSADYETKRR